MLCECGGTYEIQLPYYICADCGKFEQYEEHDDKEFVPINNLKMAGPDIGKFKRENYNTQKVNTIAKQIEKITNEYYKMNRELGEQGGKIFPKDAIAYAAKMFVEIKKVRTMKSTNKLRVMAGCLYVGCIVTEYKVSDIEIIELTKLKKKNLSAELDEIAEYIENGVIECDKFDLFDIELKNYTAELNVDCDKIKQLIEYSDSLFIGYDYPTKIKILGSIHLLNGTPIMELAKIKKVKTKIITDYVKEISDRKRFYISTIKSFTGIRSTITSPLLE